MDEVSENLHGHTGVMLNADTAAKLGIREGDRVEVRSHIGATYGKAAVMKGIRPDTIVILGQFDHWATPYIKDQERASLNTVAPMSIETDGRDRLGRRHRARLRSPHGQGGRYEEKRMTAKRYGHGD